jgi:hypothetical protein
VYLASRSDLTLTSQASWARQKEEGQYDQDKYPALGYSECIGGYATGVEGDANQTFKCSNVRPRYVQDDEIIS